MCHVIKKDCVISSRYVSPLPAYLAESEFDVRELLLKRLVHVFLQIGRFDVFYYRRLEGKICKVRDRKIDKTAQKKRSEGREE